MPMKVLIIEDDTTLNRLLVLHLTHKGYETVSALGGMEGLLLATQAQPDLVLLDVMMPIMDGWEVIERLRRESDVPVVLLTAKAMTHDVIRGLQLGADDYIRKPFNLEELDLRIEAVLRRANQGVESRLKPCYDDGVLVVNIQRHVMLRRGQEVHLSPTEFRLLCYLIENQPRVMAHEQILSHVWGPEYAADVSVLSVYIRYLRQKLEDDPSKPHYIHTEWGVGYRFDPLAQP
jgi:two-component system, OmpR family, KDP operon response regulator KdpE